MIHYDPYMPEIKENPHPIYARMRAESAVYHVERFDAWALTLFDDIWEALADREHYSVRNEMSDVSLLERRPSAFESLPSLDAPVHDVLRKRLFPHFSPAAARRMEDRIRRWAIDCLERHEGRIDAVAELAQQVAVHVACAINGFPEEDSDYLIDVVARFFAREKGVEGIPPAGHRAREEMWDYMGRFAAGRVKAGDTSQHDVLGKLLGERQRWGEEKTLQKVSEHLAILLIAATDSANRDEREFERPDVFDIHRDPPRILTFGNGIHRCFGTFFAQLEGRVLFEELLARAPEYEVIEPEAVLPPTEFVQGYSSLPIQW